MQSQIFEVFPDSLLEICGLNADAPVDYLRSLGMRMPMTHHSDAAFARMKIGWQFGAYPPLYLLIDKQGVIRLRSVGQGAVTIERVAELAGELLRE